MGQGNHNIWDSGTTPLVLLCPAWKRGGTARRVKANTVILRSPADGTILFADSLELLRNSGLPQSALIAVGAALNRPPKLASGQALLFEL
jgi:hypothetical protein